MNTQVDQIRTCPRSINDFKIRGRDRHLECKFLRKLPFKLSEFQISSYRISVLFIHKAP